MRTDLNPLKILLLASLTTGCATGQPQPAPAQDRAQDSRPCADVLTDFDGLVARATQALGGVTTDADLQTFKERQSDHRRVLAETCERQEVDHMCQSLHFNALSRLTSLIETEGEADARHLRWLVEPRLGFFDKPACGQEKQEAPWRCLDNAAQGCGFIGASVTLKCERDTPEGPASIPNCHGATLREGDRFMLSIDAQSDAYFMILLATSDGLLQPLFPPGAPEAGFISRGGYDFPGRGMWLTLDDNGGVLTQIIVIASNEELPTGQALLSSSRSDDAAFKSLRKRLEIHTVRGGELEMMSRGIIVDPLTSRGIIVDPLTSRGVIADPLTSRGAIADPAASPTPASDVRAPGIMKSGGQTTELPSRLSAAGLGIIAFEFVFKHAEAAAP